VRLIVSQASEHFSYEAVAGRSLHLLLFELPSLVLLNVISCHTTNTFNHNESLANTFMCKNSADAHGDLYHFWIGFCILNYLRDREISQRPVEISCSLLISYVTSIVGLHECTAEELLFSRTAGHFFSMLAHLVPLYCLQSSYWHHRSFDFP